MQNNQKIIGIFGAGGFFAPAPHEPHFLPGSLLRLSAASPERPTKPGSPGVRPVRTVLRLGPDPPTKGPDLVRGVDGEPLWMASVPNLLQDLHGEGVGRTGRRTAGRLGRPTDKEPLALPGRLELPHPPPEPEGNHQPHRGVRVPEVRTGDDVGAVPRVGRRPGIRGAPRAPGPPHSTRRRPGPPGGGGRARRPGHVPGQPRHLLDAPPPPPPGHGPADTRPRAPGG